MILMPGVTLAAFALCKRMALAIISDRDPPSPVQVGLVITEWLLILGLLGALFLACLWLMGANTPRG